MKPKILAIVVLLLTASATNAQFFDKYGLSIGASYANQKWDYKLIPYKPDFGYKFGIAAFLFAEKDLSNVFSLKTELGYIQKGFKDNMELRDDYGNIYDLTNSNVVLHNLELEFGVKVHPFKLKSSPYGILGLYGDYLISYKDASFLEHGSGLEYKLHKQDLKSFNKVTMGAFAGVGFELNRQFYIELGYSPALSNTYNDESLKVKDQTFELKVGVQLNRKKKEVLPAAS